MGYYISFVVRVWTESGQDMTRGHIQHVGTREGMYFADWEKMIGFIRSHLYCHANAEMIVRARPLATNQQGGNPDQWQQP